MARSTASGSSNNRLERWDAIRLGISSSTSESMLDKSGASGTTVLPSPALDAENRFFRGLPPRPASSSVDLTDGSGQETGSSPLSRSGSSEDSAPPREATPDLDQCEPHEIMEMAREAYQNSNYEGAENLLVIAEERGANPDAVASARGYVRDARARALAGPPPQGGGTGTGPSEEDPASGGMLVP